MSQIPPLRDVTSTANVNSVVLAKPRPVAPPPPTIPSMNMPAMNMPAMNMPAMSTNNSNDVQRSQNNSQPSSLSSSQCFLQLRSSSDFNAAVGAPMMLHSRVAPPIVETQEQEYANDIIQHLMLREHTMNRDPNYLANQSEVTERMRMILVDWLVDVAIKFKVRPETYFLCVDVVDRFLMVASVNRTQLQLVGVTAMLLAAKHEEIWPPEVKDCIYISANTYSREEIITMERRIATCLEFKLTVPTPYPFAVHLLECLNANENLRNATLFYLDCSSMDVGCLNCPTSVVGYAAVYLGCQTVGILESTEYLFRYYTRSYEIGAVFNAAEQILIAAKQMSAANGKFQAIRRKFAMPKYGSMSNIPLPSEVQR